MDSLWIYIDILNPRWYATTCVAPLSTVNLAASEQPSYNVFEPPGSFAQKEVRTMKEVFRLIEAIIASMIGTYVCRLADDVVKLLGM